WFNEFIRRKSEGSSRCDWLPSNAVLLYARLRSRLIVDMSGGVMENANVLIDRQGFPYIPGSAVKGCARRMALQALHDWIASGADHPEWQDVGASCCDGFNSPGEMLAAVARIFGWTEKDWDSGKRDDLFRTDFGWACGNNHDSVWSEASQHLSRTFHWNLS